MTARPADRLIVGRYALQSRLGSGGMGTVWKAEDQLLQRAVAIKEIAVPPGLDDGARAGFEARVAREARAVSRLSHPSAVTMYDQVTQDDRTFLVMELVDAPTLAEMVERDGPLPPERAARIGLDVLGALRAAHRVGMVHRDVKPSNIMVPAEGPAKLTDFGVVSVQDDTNVTSTGMVLGSPNYMAPEQATGAAVSAATDIWGLGATLYLAVEGEPPFRRDTPIATVTAAVHSEPRPMQRSGALGPVVERMLTKDPQRRPDDQDAERALLGVLNGPGAGPAPSPARAVGPPPVAPATAAGPAPAVDRPARRARAWATPLIVVVCLVLIATGTWWGMGQLRHRRGGPASATAPTTVPDGAGTAVPKGWKTIQRQDAGFNVSCPAAWSVSQTGSLTDLREPGTGTYLRVDWTPKATPSAIDAWRNLEGSFKARYPDYQRVRLEPTTFHGSTNAAVWEFTYTDGGAALHAVDIGFVSGGRGYAFNFQTHADRWDAAQPLRRQLEAGFRITG